MSLPDNFEEAVQSMSDSEIKERIANLTVAALETRRMMKENEDLNKAKEALKLLKEPFTEAIKEANEQVAYCKSVLDDRGKVA